MVRGGTMNHWMWLVSLVGILSTAVVCGTDMFFLTIGRPALRLASPSAGTEVMGFHMLADARMPIWGVRVRSFSAMGSRQVGLCESMAETPGIKGKPEINCRNQAFTLKTP